MLEKVIPVYCLFALFMLVASLPTAADEPLIVGILDKKQCVKDAVTSARLLFMKNGERWIGLDNEYEVPKNLKLPLSNFTIAFDGRAIGNVDLRDPNSSAPKLNDWFYARDKLYEPLNPGNIPVIKNTGGQFGGWCQTPGNRPLVLVSNRNYVDPDKWRTFLPGQQYKEKLFVPLKLVVGRFNAVRCLKGAERSVPWNFKPDDLVLYKAYRSAAGQELVSIGLDRKKVDCEFMAESRFSNHWFLLEGEKLEFLGTELELVDAGDYDKDGHSELLFWHSGYNSNGYVLVYDRMQRKVEYVWSYH